MSQTFFRWILIGNFKRSLLATLKISSLEVDRKYPITCLKCHNSGWLRGCDVYLAKYTHHSDMDVQWYGATSTTRRETEECNGYMKKILPGLRKIL
jgi:hypothetical protein